MRLTVEGPGARRLDKYLTGRFPKLSRALVMKYLKEGRARLNGRRARPGLHVTAGDELELPDWEECVARIRAGRAAGVPEVVRRPPEGILVLYEDEDLVVVDKPAGLVMHPGKGHEEEGLDRILREHFGPATRLVHRIDRDTSGVVVAARGHPKAAQRLADAFKAGDVEKVYLALVSGVPEPAAGTIDAPLLDTKRAGDKVRVDSGGGKAARTDYRTREAFARFAWLEVRPLSGRRHQIRAHLAHVGHALAVDHIYAKRSRIRLRDLRPDVPVSWKNPVVLGRQALHAAKLTLRHPRTGEETTFQAPLADDLEEALRLLRGRSLSE
ncbi:MAG: RluA family pseudouridine synthase [Planctomycetota bacterium]|jgi:23S rRNA pseudouridine1911/1915/1917 synthase